MRIHIIAGLDKQVAVEAITPYLYERGHDASSYVQQEVWRRDMATVLPEDFAGEAPRLPKDIDDVDVVFCIGPLDKHDAKALREVNVKGIPTYGFWPSIMVGNRNVYAQSFQKFDSPMADDIAETIWLLEMEEMEKCEPRPPESIDQILIVLCAFPGWEKRLTVDRLVESLIPFGINGEQAIRIADTLEDMSWLESFGGVADGERGYALGVHAKGFYETYCRTHAKRMDKEEAAASAEPVEVTA